MKSVVVCYSRFGHTAKVAEALARELGAEVRRIEEVKQRSFMVMGWGSTTNARFEIKPMDLDLSGCDTIVLCTPIWAGKPACPARTFLHDARLEGKKVHLLISTGGGEIDKPVAVIAGDLAKKNATVGATSRVVTGMGKKGSTDDELRQAGREFARKVKGAGS
jgi:multimeric flavodoxin WrbA